jgi:integrase/recombinase XerD
MSNGLTLHDLFGIFLQQKRIENKSDRTIDWYKDKVTKFFKHLESHGHSTLVSAITAQHLTDFLSAETTRSSRFNDHPNRRQLAGGLSPYSLHAYVRGLRSFFGWVHQEGYTQTHLAAKLKAPKLPKDMVAALSEEQISAILATIQPNTALGARFLAILLVLYATGIRASELCGLTTKDVHLDKQFIKVKGKGRKERVVPLGANAQMALLRYLKVFRPEPHPLHADYVFLTTEGYRLSPGALDQIFGRLSRRVGFRVYPHLMRHTFAVDYLINNQSTDPFSLQAILGHEDMNTVRIYVNLAQRHIEIQHQKFNPADKLDLRNLRRKTFK